MNRFVEVLLILLCPCIGLHTAHGVYNDPVVIDLSDLIEVAEVVEADFTVEGKEKLVHLTCDAHINITQPPVHVDKHNIVVEDEQIHN